MAARFIVYPSVPTEYDVMTIPQKKDSPFTICRFQSFFFYLRDIALCGCGEFTARLCTSWVLLQRRLPRVSLQVLPEASVFENHLCQSGRSVFAWATAFFCYLFFATIQLVAILKCYDTNYPIFPVCSNHTLLGYPF